MRKIRRLPTHIANQIAAGEVVERPASALKELVENALDADASSIEISLLRGGKELIEVKDNGVGMSREDLELCIEPHATSKIDSEEDLAAITTLGFRGEALASIAAVSRLTVASRQKGAEGGWKLQVDFGMVGPVLPEPCPQGTVVRVQDLFLKTPARAKFLKADQTEYARCLKVVQLFCAAFPEVGFRLKRQGRHVLSCRAGAPLKERIEPLLGKQAMEHLREVKRTYAGMEISGFVADPGGLRLTSRHLYFFLNRRPVSSPVLWKAVKDALAGYLVKGNQPAGVMFLDVPPETVDVNVHPTKLEVRFQDPGHIYRLVFHGVRDALENQQEAFHLGPLSEVSNVEKEVEGEPDQSASSTSSFDLTLPPSWFEKDEAQAPAAFVQESSDESVPYVTQTNKDDERAEVSDVTTEAKAEASSGLEIIGQFAKSYILFERNGKLTVLDQHAAHEALLFQEFMEELKTRGVLSRQNLLIPKVIDAKPEWMGDIELAFRVLQQIGIEAESFGESQVVVRSVPALLSGAKQRGDTVEETVIEVLKNPHLDSSELLRSCISRLSCSLATKAGKRLARAEMEALVNQCLDKGVTNCPHGRPIMVEIGLDELHKRFFRK